MTARSVQFALFDLDGTLTDPFVGISRCIVHALEQLGVPVPDRAALRSWIGPPLLGSFANWFSHLDVSAEPEWALELYRERFSTRGLYENRVYDGIPGLLNQLRGADIGMFVATAKPHAYARRILEAFGLAGYFQHCYGSELDGTRTDKVELLTYLVAQEQLDGACCAMIGDRLHDMEAARYHGMEAIGVGWGYGTREELLSAGADLVVESPMALRDCLIADRPAPEHPIT
ncbi:MAG: HAD hydrolase-like protein [Xanthomonadales bacterium]|nr:HAD hydrolase-like protein [Xanthomonadales bacterium]